MGFFINLPRDSKQRFVTRRPRHMHTKHTRKYNIENIETVQLSTWYSHSHSYSHSYISQCTVYNFQFPVHPPRTVYQVDSSFCLTLFLPCLLFSLFHSQFFPHSPTPNPNPTPTATVLSNNKLGHKYSNNWHNVRNRDWEKEREKFLAAKKFNQTFPQFQIVHCTKVLLHFYSRTKKKDNKIFGTFFTFYIVHFTFFALRYTHYSSIFFITHEISHTQTAD